jgi:hypothetical protein
MYCPGTDETEPTFGPSFSRGYRGKEYALFLPAPGDRPTAALRTITELIQIEIVV